MAYMMSNQQYFQFQSPAFPHVMFTCRTESAPRIWSANLPQSHVSLHGPRQAS
jgi:hypothetical protein